MTKQKSTKRALLLSALSLLACVSMLIGSTFAWFTDSVTSAGNKIQAGTLQVDLELLEENGTWTSIKESNKAIFDYRNWEPGYTDVKILRVSNKGTLALKWLAKFVSANELTELAEVIDVYVNTEVQAYPADRTNLDGWTSVGTVADFVNDISETTKGTLEAGDSAYLGIALKMQESAGNKYQGMDLGGAFDIQIVATQYTSESDSFNNQYDVNAEMPGRPATTEEKSALGVLLQTAEDGETIYLDAIDYGEIYVGAGLGVEKLPENLTIVGDASTRMSISISNNFAVNGWTFKNITFTGEGLFITNGADAQNVTVDGCTFALGADLYFKKASGDVTITNSKFYSNSKAKGIYIQNGTNVTVDKCTFNDNTNAVNISASGIVVVSNNTVNGTTDRALRFASSSATIKVTGNTIVSNGDTAGELMKANGGVTDANITLSGNTWNGQADSDVSAGMVGTDYIVK